MDPLSVYRDLADHYDRMSQSAMRDRFLILAADAAMSSGNAGLAESFRQRLLATSKYHMLRPYASFAEAVQAPDVQTYLRDLRANYPFDVARELLLSVRGDAPPVESTQPLPYGGRAPIPPTAPVVDPFGRAPAPPRGDAPPKINNPWMPAKPTALPPAEALEHTPAPPARQPDPYRAPRPPIQPPREPDVIPFRQEQRQTAAPTPPVTQAAPPPPVPRVGWFGGFLAALVAIVGLALTAFTLGRPFLPAGWLP